MAGKWNSFDIPLTDFPGLDFKGLFQFKFDGGAGQTFYLDNLYLYKNASTGIGAIETTDAPKRAGVFTIDGRQVRAAGQDASNLPSGFYIIDGKKVVVK